MSNTTIVRPEAAVTPKRRRWVGVLVWLLVAPTALWAAIRLTGFVDYVFPWVQLVAFTPFVAAASFLVLLLAALSRRWLATALALAAAVTLAAVSLPRTFADSGPVAKGAGLRVLAANTMVGQADAAELMALVIRLKPDVLALQELTPQVRERLDDAGLRDVLPFAVDRSRAGVGGSGIYSRYPLTEQPFIEFGRFGQARALVKPPGGAAFEFVSVHPCAPSLKGNRTPCWREGLEALPREGDALRVLAGDFNATLDHRPVRDLLSAGYRDAADVTGDGLTATWPQRGWGPVPGVTIDHILADQRIAVRSFSVHKLSGTDHRPVFAELTLP